MGVEDPDRPGQHSGRGRRVSRRAGIGTRSCPPGGRDVAIVQALGLVDHEGKRPGRRKHADDGEAESVEVVVERPDSVPGATGQAEPAADEAECLDATDECGLSLSIMPSGRTDDGGH